LETARGNTNVAHIAERTPFAQFHASAGADFRSSSLDAFGFAHTARRIEHMSFWFLFEKGVLLQWFVRMSTLL
jgi:hypothetical protein